MSESIIDAITEAILYDILMRHIGEIESGDTDESIDAGYSRE